MTLTQTELDAIRARAEKAMRSITPEDFTDEVIETVEEDVPKLLAEVERYKYALESIVNIDGMFIDDGFDVEKAYDVIDEIARKALGGANE